MAAAEEPSPRTHKGAGSSSDAPGQTSPSISGESTLSESVPEPDTGTSTPGIIEQARRLRESGLREAFGEQKALVPPQPDIETQDSSRFRSTLSQAEHRERENQGLEAGNGTVSGNTGEERPKNRRPQAKKTAKQQVSKPTAPQKAAASPSAIKTAEESGKESTALHMTLAQALALPKSATAGAILEAAGMMAFRRSGEPELTFGVVTLLKACIAVGLGQVRNDNSSPAWFCEWLIEQGVKRDALESFARQARRRTLGDLTQIRLSPNAAAVLRQAAALATVTNETPLLGARHILLAIHDHAERKSAEAMRAELHKAFRIDFDLFRPVLIDRVIANLLPDESMALWQELHEASVTALLAKAGKAVPKLHARADAVVNLNADRPSPTGPDPLGVAADVSAFARLICLEEATPPLSIGLFGEWGSGKSSFMERLQGEIAKLTGKERDDRKARIETSPGPRFVENVVQIRFNAWHFADANLWASLTAEFFDQLRRGGHDGLRSSNYLALVGKVADRVRSLEAAAQKAGGELAAAAAAVKKADEALVAARAKLAASDLSLASEHLGKSLETFQKENAKSLKDVGTRVYRNDLSQDIDGLKAAVTEASTIPGKIALVSRVLAGGGASTWLAVGAVVLVAAGAVGWQAGDPASTAVLVQRLIAWGGGALAALGALWQALGHVRPILDAAWTYAKAVEAERKKLAEEVARRETEAKDAKDKLGEAQTALNEAKAPLAQYGQGAQTSAPGTILRYFLFEDGDVRDYDKHVGLVSRARRSFEQLDAIVATDREGPAARQKKARGEALTAKELAALERFEAMQLGEAGLRVPDRIVLYIDDLDRCTHQQVYDVLQAIHLLLAFELFVVVVGVDVRWVEEAVARQFVVSVDDLPDSATAADHEAARRRAETERRKRAIDYLEKIFQLPFWLRPLSTQGAQATYGVYVRGLLQANLEATGESPLAPVKPAIRTKAATGGAEALTDAFVAPQPDARESVAADDGVSLDEALATVKLTQSEVDFLASPEIGALAAKSPRAVKRMINVYRIIRARMSEPELAEFLGQTGKPPTWPIAAFLAAVECGQPVEVADAMYEAITEGFQTEILNEEEVASIVGLAISEIPDIDDLYDQLPGQKKRFRSITEGLSKLAEHRGSDPIVADILTMARIVRRYSFNRYH